MRDAGLSVIDDGLVFVGYSSDGLDFIESGFAKRATIVDGSPCLNAVAVELGALAVVETESL